MKHDCIEKVIFRLKIELQYQVRTIYIWGGGSGTCTSHWPSSKWYCLRIYKKEAFSQLWVQHSEMTQKTITERSVHNKQQQLWVYERQHRMY